MTRKISEILKNSTSTKIRGHLKDCDGVEGETRYCALGVLGCQAGLLPDPYVSGSESLYEKILRAYKVPSEMIDIDFRNELDFRIEEIGTFAPTNLSQLIYGLNDCTAMSFKEIGEFVETNLGL